MTYNKSDDTESKLVELGIQDSQVSDFKNYSTPLIFEASGLFGLTDESPESDDSWESNPDSSYFRNELENIEESILIEDPISILEDVSPKLENEIESQIFTRKCDFILCRNYAFKCMEKLNDLPAIRVHELWRRTPLSIRETIYAAFSIIVIHQVQLWVDIDDNFGKYFLNWGENYLRHISEFLVIPDCSLDKTIRLFNLHLSDKSFRNIAHIEPLRDAIMKYCIEELQPKVLQIYYESIKKKKIRKSTNNEVLVVDDFLFGKSYSDDEDNSCNTIQPNPSTHLNCTKNSHYCSKNTIQSDFLNLSLPKDLCNNHRRKTWHQGSIKNFQEENLAPSPNLILILALVRLHAIYGILDARSLTILYRIQLVLCDNKNILELSPILLDCIQILTYTNTKKNQLQTDIYMTERSYNKSWRHLKVLGATIVGGAVLATATALAAPGIIAGLGALGLGYTSMFGSAVAASTGAAALTTVAGVSGASLSGWKMSRRESPLKIFRFHQVGSNKEKYGLLPIIIGISGWLRSKEDITKPWKIAFNGLDWMESYAVEFEPQILSQLGKSIALTMSQDLAIFAGKAILLQTIVGTLTAALSWPITLMQYAATLDNTWAVSRQKTEKAALVLADILGEISLVGERPIRLVGYSMGARLIFLTLQILYDRKHLHKVFDVILIGMPTSLDKNKWTKARAVVSNRLINVYTRSDWVLAFFYRYMQWGLHVAGIAPVENIIGVENYDVTGIIHGHDQYPDRIRDILYLVNFL
ncbi:uncharacterized protein CMU_028420 [Cryptosporidium muris RN66]|uniref:Transmembrane protein n=1 Tax=Cryptosporidium muris (strain RN66) TaxID=441375 RepID=B6AHS7_CRYMR|nr:uncharacterized protein CMU_028420 [Cryptosporidium muris RN66]EEA07768.1 hypothetical protein, conserved [Cryptosporidium muris RN66]|eukprot:XP_002142117.1 hypothetical protein [Cryptosporidium muris RN66]